VVNSRAVRDYYLAQGIDSNKLVLIPNGIFPGCLPNVDRTLILQELDIPPEAQVLGFVGRLWAQKRVRDAIWATEVLRNIRSNLFLLIIGDGPERTALFDFVKKIELMHRVRFLGQRDDVPRFLSAMDIFVLPSQFEGMPNAVMEAMNASLPVVASDIPGTNELVIDGETGLLYPTGDTKALAVRLNRLLDDSVLRTKLGQTGQRRVRQEFSVERMVEAHVRLYRELASRNDEKMKG
jgi:glycosyltransferase involved in cell wall biosynthesis